jgi:hypothetical protein
MSPSYSPLKSPQSTAELLPLALDCHRPVFVSLNGRPVQPRQTKVEREVSPEIAPVVPTADEANAPKYAFSKTLLTELPTKLAKAKASKESEVILCNATVQLDGWPSTWLPIARDILRAMQERGYKVRMARELTFELRYTMLSPQVVTEWFLDGDPKGFLILRLDENPNSLTELAGVSNG